MGFGHRVYKAEDPRAEILRGMAAEASTPEFFELSRRTEERALAMLHERKPDRRLYTNVEFYSAAVLGSGSTGRYVYADLRRLAGYRLDRACARADVEQSFDPPAIGVRWPDGQEVRRHRAALSLPLAILK